MVEGARRRCPPGARWRLRRLRTGPQVHGGAPLRLLGFTTPRPRLRSVLPQTEDAPPSHI